MRRQTPAPRRPGRHFRPLPRRWTRSGQKIAPNLRGSGAVYPCHPDGAIEAVLLRRQPALMRAGGVRRALVAGELAIAMNRAAAGAAG